VQRATLRAVDDALGVQWKTTMILLEQGSSR
jgi:hypothetical protein